MILNHDIKFPFSPHSLAQVSCGIQNVQLAPTTDLADVPPSGMSGDLGGNASSLPAEELLAALWLSPELVHQLCIMQRPGKEFINLPVESAGEAVSRAASHTESGDDCYFACAEYASPDNRKAENVVGACGFWMDIDCGNEKVADGKGYRDTAEAYAEVANFCRVAKLPEPTHVVESGGGLHVYWALSQRVDAYAWKIHAVQLKALAKKLRLLADPCRTADIASVLRVPGTLNRKCEPARAVVLTRAVGRAVDRDTMLLAIGDAHSVLCNPAAVTSTTPATAFVRANVEVKSPPDLTRLASALKCLDPDCDEATWKLKRLAPMAKAARAFPDLAVELKNLARRWSSGELRGAPSTAWAVPGASNNITGEVAFDVEWNRFFGDQYTGKPVTLGTIYHDASAVGWKGSTEEFDVVVSTATDADGGFEQRARETMLSVLSRAKGGDSGAPLEPDSITALALIDARSPADYQRTKVQLTRVRHQRA